MTDYRQVHILWCLFPLYLNHETAALERICNPVQELLKIDGVGTIILLFYFDFQWEVYISAVVPSVSGWLTVLEWFGRGSLFCPRKYPNCGNMVFSEGKTYLTVQ